MRAFEGSDVDVWKRGGETLNEALEPVVHSSVDDRAILRGREKAQVEVNVGFYLIPSTESDDVPWGTVRCKACREQGTWEGHIRLSIEPEAQQGNQLTSGVS